MSMYGWISFYREAPLDRPLETTIKVMEMCGVTRLESACAERWRGDKYEVLAEEGYGFRDWEGFLRRHLALGVYVRFACLGTAIGDEMYDAIEQGVDESIRGYFIPCELVVAVGPNWKIDQAFSEERDDWVESYHACSLSVDFHSYMYPEDPVEFLNQVYRVPGVVAIQQRLETLLGPLKRAACWNW